MPYQQGNLSVILIRLVGFIPTHACTGDEKDCLYIKDACLGKNGDSVDCQQQMEICL